MADQQDNLKTIYEEVCRSHQGISDFRTKLLALLPTGSLTAILFLGTESQLKNPVLGVFAACVTFGLFIYEVRGIQYCKALIKSAKSIESKLHAEDPALGAFSSKPSSFWFFGNTEAALVIYPAVIAVWLYYPLQGLVPSGPVYAFGAAFGAFLAFFLIGYGATKKPQWIVKLATKFKRPPGPA